MGLSTYFTIYILEGYGVHKEYELLVVSIVAYQDHQHHIDIDLDAHNIVQEVDVHGCCFLALVAL